MTWPWVSRTQLEAAESRLRWTEKELAKAEERVSTIEARAEESTTRFLKDIERLVEEQKILLDRIAQLSGQPPIFHPAPVVAAPVVEKQAEPAHSIPAPATRISPDELKRKARQAIDSGQFDKPKAAVV